MIPHEAASRVQALHAQIAPAPALRGYDDTPVNYYVRTLNYMECSCYVCMHMFHTQWQVFYIFGITRYASAQR